MEFESILSLSQSEVLTVTLRTTLICLFNFFNFGGLYRIRIDDLYRDRVLH